MNPSKLRPVDSALAEDEENNAAEDRKKERTVFYQPEDEEDGVTPNAGPRVSTGVAISHPNYDNHKLEDRLKSKPNGNPNENANGLK